MKHITEKEINAYFSYQLSPDEEQALLQHTAQCPFCADRLAAAFPEQELITPPPGLKEDILAEAHKIKSDKATRKQEFRLYQLKVGLAMAMALFLLFAGDLTCLYSNPKENKQNTRSVSSVLHTSSSIANQALTDWSHQLCQIMFDQGRDED